MYVHACVCLISKGGERSGWSTNTDLRTHITHLAYQDGGLLANNPCAIALREARLLWGRHAPLQCVLSLGTGIYRRGPASPSESLANTSLKDKLTKVVASATDTEGERSTVSYCYGNR